jgi:hypothetical protein
MKRVLLLFLFTSSFSFAQSVWEKFEPNGYVYNAICQTNDNCYLTTQDVNFQSGYLVKIDSSGNIVWKKRYMPVDAIDYGKVIQITDGNYLMGWRLIGLDSIMCVLLIKTDTAGNVLQQKMYKNTDSENFNYLGGLFEAPNGNIYVLAQGSPGVCLPQRILYLNPNLDLLWSKRYCSTPSTGNYNSACVMDNGELYMATNSNYSHLVIHKYNINGLQYQSVKVSFPAGTFVQTGYITKTTAGGYAVLSTNRYGTRWNPTLCIFDSSDNIVSSKILDTTYVFWAPYAQLNPVCMGEYLICPAYKASGKFRVFKTNLSGNILDAKERSISPYAIEALPQICVTSDNGFAAIIGTTLLDNYIIKSDFNFNLPCFSAFSFFDSTLSLNAIDTVYMTDANQSVDTFSVSYSVTAVGSSILNNDCAVSTTELLLESTLLEIYPNPSLNTFTISFNGQLSMIHGQLKIFDVTGRVVHEQNLTSAHQQISNYFESGIYFVKVATDEKVYSQKLVKE